MDSQFDFLFWKDEQIERKNWTEKIKQTKKMKIENWKIWRNWKPEERDAAIKINPKWN